MKIEIIKEINSEIINFSKQINVYYKNINNLDLLKKYKKEKIEAIVLLNEEKIAACCFLRTIKYKNFNINWLFNFYSENKSGYGALIIKYAMNNYSNLCCVGVTEDAKKIYKILRWKELTSYYRYTKVINIKLFIKQYKNRMNFFSINALKIFFFINRIIYLLNFKKINKCYESYNANNIIRFFNNKKKINFNIGREIYKNKDVIAAEFLSQRKQKKLNYLLNGFIKIKTPIFYFSKFNDFDEKFILNNINCFKDTDKIF